METLAIFYISAALLCGRKPDQQDVIYLQTSFGAKNQNLLAIFDGHEGNQAAIYASEHIEQLIHNAWYKTQSMPSAAKQTVFKETFSQLNFMMQTEHIDCGTTGLVVLAQITPPEKHRTYNTIPSPNTRPSASNITSTSNDSSTNNANVNGSKLLKPDQGSSTLTDRPERALPITSSSSTDLSKLGDIGLNPKELIKTGSAKGNSKPQGKLYIINAGDTRCVLSKQGKAQRISHDHRPIDRSERNRIRDLGGYVTTENRVNGILQVSRSFGDFHLAPFVSVEPNVHEYELTGDEEFIVLASDGIWDWITDQDAVDIISSEPDRDAAASRLRDFSYLLGSQDNIAVVVAFF